MVDTSVSFILATFGTSNSLQSSLTALLISSQVSTRGAEHRISEKLVTNMVGLALMPNGKKRDRSQMSTDYSSTEEITIISNGETEFEDEWEIGGTWTKVQSSCKKAKQHTSLTSDSYIRP